MNEQKFIDEIHQGYTTNGITLNLGSGILNGEAYKDATVKIPLKMLNRHGLIAGATGSGKTKTLQIIAEQLSKNGVPSLLMDIKGDLSGIAMPGTLNTKIAERAEKVGIPFEARGSDVEFLSLSGENGLRLRATLTEFGPILFSKILNLNDVQQGVVALIFKYCDDHQLPLLDLADFKKVIQFLTNEGKAEIIKEYGAISPATTGTVMRKILELEQQDATHFFGEPSFDVQDLLRTNSLGEGMISILRLNDLQDRPKLFSTFMLQLLAEIFNTFPEVGDLEKPKLAFFIDEAHLIFSEASKALCDQIVTTVKLIRSKGVGIFFITQSPADIPNEVLSQLGLKIQHALRAFTAKDRKDIKLTSENFPLSSYYKIDQVLTSLGIGEALITSLNEKGIPTPLVHTLLRAPESRMDILSNDELQNIIQQSEIMVKYQQVNDRQSAYEILSERLASLEEYTEESKPKSKEEKSIFSEVINSPTSRQIGRTVAREITRGILGVLGLGGRSTRKKTGWF